MHIFNKQKFENEFERLTYRNKGKNANETSKFITIASIRSKFVLRCEQHPKVP